MSTMRKPLFVISSLVILTLSCAFATSLIGGKSESGVAPGTAPPPTETTEPEAQPTEVRRRELPPTPTPFHVLSEDDVRSVLDLSRPDYVDYFDTPGTWFDYDTEGRAAYRFEDGHLLGVDYEPEEIYSWWSYADRQSGNVYAEISATNGDCIGRDAVGFVIRVDAEEAFGGYALEVSCDGEWRFIRHRKGGQPEVMIDWTASPEIKTGKGATNRLGIWGYQRRFVLFINGQQVGEAIDHNYSYSFGTFAVYVKALQTYDLTATFDDFAFWHIPFLP